MSATESLNYVRAIEDVKVLLILDVMSVIKVEKEIKVTCG